MFIKNIKISGLFGITGIKEHNFTYKDDRHTDSEDNYINSISDLRIIQGLLLIFDLKHDSKFNYKDVINRNHKGESFVEITLHQKEGDKFSHYDWLMRNELKLKRVFQSPKVIFINKKRCELSIFHHALNSLGFHNINDLSIHKLMDNDIVKVSRFVGDDFWNMLIKMIEHEEIIEMVERREGVVKQKAMHRSYDIVTDTIMREIPKKVQLRNEIYERIQLNKNFFSLLYIIYERKIECLNKQKDFADQNVQELKQVINANISNEHKKKRECFANFNQILTAENILKMFQEMHHELNFFAENYKGEAREQLIFFFLEGFAKFTTLSIDKFLEPDYDHNKYVDSEIAATKLSLAESIKSGKFEETKEALKTMNEFDNQFINFLDSDHAFPLFDNITKGDCSMNKDLISEFEQWRIREELEIAKSMHENCNSADEYLSQINKYLVDLKISNDEFETLLKIERLVESFEEIKDDYLGPVFNFLDTASGLDVKMWNDISSIAYTILFKTSESTQKFVEKFLEIEKDFAGYTFCSIDDYPIKEFDENIHDSDSFISMRNLIKKNLSKQLENVLLTLLHPYLLADETDYEDLEVDELGAFCIKLYDNVSSVSNHDGMTFINSEWNNIWELSEKGPVQAAQEYHNLVKEYMKIDTKLSEINDRKSNCNKNFVDKKFTVLDGHLTEIFKSTSMSNEKNDPMINARKDVLNKMNEVLATNEEECNEWDSEELKEMGNFTAMISAYEQYNHIDSTITDHNILVQFINLKLSEAFVKCEGVHNRTRTREIRKLKNSENFRKLLERIDIYEAVQLNKSKDIDDLQESSEIYAEDVSESYEQMRDFGTRYGEKVVIEDMIAFLRKNLKNIINYSTVSFKQSIYDDFQNQDLQVIVDEISDVYTRLLRLKAVNRMDLKCLDPAAYQNLVNSLGKVREFSNKELYNPMKVRKRAYPLMNVVVVKVLKDTVQNFTLTYNSVLSDYISHSNLYFYAKSEMNEIDDTNFTWRYFDISKLKSIDFVEKWKDEKRILPAECRQLIKALLLILHIINYLSVFKFIIISEKLFEGMDKDLVIQLRKFLKNISKFVQIILYEESANEENAESMEVDYLEE